MKDKKLNFKALLFLSILYLIAILLIPQFYSFSFLFLIFGFILLINLSQTIAFVYAFLFVIDPLNIFNLSGQIVVPITLCLTTVLFNYKYYIPKIINDKPLLYIIRVCLVFTLYQLIITLMLKSQQDLYYVLENANYWFGVWVLIPAYIFTYTDRVNIFASIILIVIITTIIYFLSMFNIVDLIEFREVNRINENNDLKRNLAFDLRFITKFFVYVLPLFIFFPIRNSKLKYLLIIIGVSVYSAVLVALLRTEIFYLFMGAVTALTLCFFKFKKINIFNSFFTIASSVVLVVLVFPNLFYNVIDTINLTLDSVSIIDRESTLSLRTDIQLPIALNILEENIFFGGGLYSVSYEATGGHLVLYDIPYIAAFSTYGLIGMSIYYLRFIYVFRRYKLVNFSQNLYNLYPVESLLSIGLMAYFVTMVFFKLIHFNIELAFDFGMAETGLFIGAFFGITRFLFEQNNFLCKDNK